MRYTFVECGHEYPGNPQGVIEERWLQKDQTDPETTKILNPGLCHDCSFWHRAANPQDGAKHWACGHDYEGEIDVPGVKHKNSGYDLVGSVFAIQGITITHPRWCDDCIDKRTRDIAVKHKFIPNAYQGRSKGVQLFQMAWNKGVRDGRIAAESYDWIGDLAEIDVSSEMRHNPTDQDLLAALVSGINIGGNDEVMDELERAFKNFSLETEPSNTQDSLKVELAFAYNEGKKAGLQYQLWREFELLHEPEGPQRSESLALTTGKYEGKIPPL